MKKTKTMRRINRTWEARAARLCGAAALLAPLTTARALAQDATPDPGTTPVIGAAALPRDLSPWGMFLSADIVVKAVIIGLAFASVVTWTIWLAKTIGIFLAKRRARAALRTLTAARSLAEVDARVSPAAEFVAATREELQLSADVLENEGLKERIA